MKVGLIGAGNMGLALLDGWISSGTVEQGSVVGSEKDPEKARLASEEYGVRLAEDNRAAAGGSTIVVLAVKPQDAGEVLREIAGSLVRGKVLVSIAAGLSIDSIRRASRSARSLARRVRRVRLP